MGNSVTGRLTPFSKILITVLILGGIYFLASPYIKKMRDEAVVPVTMEAAPEETATQEAPTSLHHAPPVSGESVKDTDDQFLDPSLPLHPNYDKSLSSTDGYPDSVLHEFKEKQLKEKVVLKKQKKRK